MKERPICVVENCVEPGWVLFSGQWVCGRCAAEYDRKMKIKSFNQLQEVVGNGS